MSQHQNGCGGMRIQDRLLNTSTYWMSHPDQAGNTSKHLPTFTHIREKNGVDKNEIKIIIIIYNHILTVLIQFSNK